MTTLFSFCLFFLSEALKIIPEKKKKKKTRLPGSATEGLFASPMLSRRKGVCRAGRSVSAREKCVCFSAAMKRTDSEGLGLREEGQDGPGTVLEAKTVFAGLLRPRSKVPERQKGALKRL